MPIWVRSLQDGTNVNFLFGGLPMKHLGEFTLRDGNRYLDLRTNIGNNTMTAMWYWGYLYNQGNCFGFWGGYPYENTLILNNYASNMVGSPSNTASSVTLTSAYRATAANSYGTCFKFDRGTTGYSEGKINIFINTHGGPSSSLTVVAHSQNNNAGNFY